MDCPESDHWPHGPRLGLPLSLNQPMASAHADQVIGVLSRRCLPFPGLLRNPYRLRCLSGRATHLFRLVLCSSAPKTW